MQWAWLAGSTAWVRLPLLSACQVRFLHAMRLFSGRYRPWTVPSGANSWRRLCPVKDAPPDDDDEVQRVRLCPLSNVTGHHTWIGGVWVW